MQRLRALRWLRYACRRDDLQRFATAQLGIAPLRDGDARQRSNLLGIVMAEHRGARFRIVERGYGTAEPGNAPQWQSEAVHYEEKQRRGKAMICYAMAQHRTEARSTER